ncbi:MAG: 5/3-nucleotidase [Thermoleophilaceae bacterium]|nr:5/3-nucleotidase [Thermoleophilaceae bacterium]
MKVLLTNDDGIQATGLGELRRALLGVPGIDLAVIAPNSNRSATARSITTRRPLEVEEVEFDDGTVGYATDGTPVDCVRLAALGLVGDTPELIVSGINHGSNLGDDITYSGTVAAALEGIVLGVPGIAVSQQSTAREMDFRLGNDFDFGDAAAFAARLVEEIESVPLPAGTLLNVNCPAGGAAGARACRLGRRIYRDTLEQVSEEDGRRHYRIYGDDPSYHSEPGTDFADASAFAARLVEEIESVPLPAGTLLNVNCPAGGAAGARACRLGRRINRDTLKQISEEDGRRHYRIYGDDPSYHSEPGTDFAAIADGLISVTPLHFDLTSAAGLEQLGGFDLDMLIRPAATEVE